jgi:hypothetical protein
VDSVLISVADCEDWVSFIENNTEEVENFEFLGLQFEAELDFLHVFVRFII